ncbi:hypothetical protein EK21DRAFT_81774, partial [Setomelanomma holmii]
EAKNSPIFLSMAAPEIVADYSGFPAVGRITRTDPETWFKAAFGEGKLGNPDDHTFTRTSETEAKDTWQVRAIHTRTLNNCEFNQWDSSGFLEQTYLKIDGVWKFGGCRPYEELAEMVRHDHVIGV